MKNKIEVFVFLIMIAFLSSCKSKKASSPKRQTKTIVNKSTSKVSKTTVDYAKTFEGTPYKYGGTTQKGMDCSGLVQISFKKYGIDLPRTTSNQKLAGKWIHLKGLLKSKNFKKRPVQNS